MTSKSSVLFEKALKYIPGGVNSPVRAYNSVGGNPFYVKSAKGSKIYTEDDKELIDYICSWGPNILGHANPTVLEAVNKACEKGLSFGANHEGEIILAEMLVNALPSVDKVRLVSSGTEATMSAIRLARGYTKRDLVVKFEGCYHGHVDGLLIKAGSGAMTLGEPDSAGIPKDYAKNTILAKYNNIENLQTVFSKYSDQIAAIIIEPVAGNMGVVLPNLDFLKACRDLTKKHNSLLIFDEVITGFRLCYGGAQNYYDIIPDLTCLGKIIGGGMPIGAYGGRAEIMNLVSPLGPVYQAGTLSGNPVAVAAGIATLKELQKDNFYETLEGKRKLITDTLAEEIEKQGIEANINFIGSAFTLFNTKEKVKDFDSAMTCNTERFGILFNLLLEKGILIPPSQFEANFVSQAHTNEDLERTVIIYKECLNSLS
ncbi:MAG: glutamate-1-semialdehyde 2,1-aminomutase [Pseudomonadota bacterium]